MTSAHPLRVLVIGARGFVGAALTRELLDRGHTVRAVDVRSDPGRLADVSDRIDWLTGDGSSPETVMAGIGRRPVDAIYYGPFYRGGPDHSVARELDVMAVGAWRVFDLARALPLRRIIFPSSTAVHGGQSGDEPVEEESPVRPSGLYGAAKLLCERVALEVNQALGNNVIAAVRLPSVYGPGAAVASRQVNVPAVQAARGRTAALDFHRDARVCVAHVGDTGRMLADVIEATDLRHTVYELGGLDTSYGEIVDGVLRQVPGADIRLGSQDQDVLPHAVDYRRGRDELGFAHRPLADGFKSIIDYELSVVNRAGAR